MYESRATQTASGPMLLPFHSHGSELSHQGPNRVYMESGLQFDSLKIDDARTTLGKKKKGLRPVCQLSHGSTADLV